MPNRLSRRILAYIACVVAVAAVNAVLAILTALQFRADLESVAYENLTSVRAAEELEIALLEQRGYVVSHVLADGAGDWLEQLRARQPAFDRWLLEAQRASQTSEEQGLLVEVEVAYGRYLQTRNAAIEAYERGDREKAKRLLLNELPRQYDAAYAICEQLIELNNSYAEEAIERQRQHVRVLIGLVIGMVTLSLIISVTVVATFYRRIVLPLRQMTLEGRAASRQPDLNADGHSEQERDELRELGEHWRQLMADVKSARADLRRSQEELARSERLATVGKLTATVAHEIRNPLTAIRMWLFTLRRSTGSPNELRQPFEAITDEISRLENIVRSFLEFARPPQPQCAVHDLKLLIGKTHELLRSRLNESRTSLEVSCPPEACMVWCDAEQTRQVLLNLLNNALDAMPDGGSIDIAASPGRLGDMPMIVVRVRDHGTGLATNAREHLFEPFFTTKAHGTGLGLPIAASIMVAQDGAITLEASGADGTEFAIWLRPEAQLGNE